jgi:hypothetical protein
MNPRRANPRLPVLALIASTLVLACCAGPQPRDPSRTPPDLSLGLAVDASAPGGAGWYVLDPDGSLHVGFGTRRADSPLPPLAKQLSPDEMSRVWGAVCSTGLADAIWNLPQASESETPAHGSNVYLAAGHARRAVVVPEGDERVAALVRELRAIAWLNEEAQPPNP